MERKNTRADVIFSAALILGALVLALVSWKLPSLVVAPMTADMRGTVELAEPSYENTRISIKLEDNVTKFTIPIETFEALEVQPEVGDEVRMKYEITSIREIRVLKVADEDGAMVTVYDSENPATARRETLQMLAFAAFGVYAVLCTVVYKVKGRKR